jgi:hypothetical protein
MPQSCVKIRFQGQKQLPMQTMDVDMATTCRKTMDVLTNAEPVRFFDVSQTMC